MSRRGCLLLMIVFVLLTEITGTAVAARAANDMGEDESVTIAAPSEYYETSKETGITPKYSKIATLSGSCSNHEGGILGLSASLYTQGGTTTSVRLVTALQVSTGSGWSTVVSWVSTGSTQVTWITSYPGKIGEIYRLRVCGVAYNDNDSESDILYTKSVLCKRT